ncbi:long-chain-fatty-acid--CoA ligase [Millisia brevis]|uniref:long-chain-fatty-acid--CoA ligase n=1 Tax=Millisia brevis TaxID=264148 RepID=UPI000833DB3F|nr:long-chain-fatty-acid--CoA ligase [Millisia brevis]
MAAASDAARLLVSNRNHWVSWVLHHATSRPDGVAFRFLGVDTTWRTLWERTEKLADALHRRGVRRGDRVLLLTLNRTEFFEAVIAINAVGAIAVPVNFRLTPPEIAYLVEDSGGTIIFTEPVLAPLVAATRKATDRIETVIVMGAAGDETTLGYEELIAEDGDGRPFVELPESDPALILYTSGTTGRPKGAVLTHLNMVAQSVTCIRALGLTDEDGRALMAAPSFHVAALGSVAPALMIGHTVVIHPLKEFDPVEVVDTLERERITTVFMVPVQWQAVCAVPGIADRDFALRSLSWGAAPATDAVLEAMERTFPDAQIVAVFGQTEMSPITCVLAGADSRRKLGSIGKPIPGISARVVDVNMNDVAAGDVGEIVYRGPTLMKEYWNNPMATAAAMDGGWFHSGDLVRADDEGFLYVVDRKKDMIISGGENIYCAEVENAIAGHPTIREVAVIGRPDDRWGEVPVAVVAGDAPPTLEELREFLGDTLARYKHPAVVEYVDTLPRNASGKVVKGRLRESHGGPLPGA